MANFLKHCEIMINKLHRSHKFTSHQQNFDDRKRDLSEILCTPQYMDDICPDHELISPPVS